MEYNAIRNKTKKIKVGNIYIGGDSPVTVQSMTNTDTSDFESTYAQVKALEDAGCEIIRLAVPRAEDAKTLYKLKDAGIKAPLVADIHFDYKIALECVSAGVDKIRINPGNIGSGDRIRAVADACKTNGIPIRIGVNGGSLEKEVLAKYGAPTAEALAESALYNIRLLEKYDFDAIAVSVKSSDVLSMIRANEIISASADYPLHLGVTEAGTTHMGMLKAASALGALMSRGIGDTVRISLTAPPIEEVSAARDILEAIGVRKPKIRIVSCPTCGRTKIDLIALAKEFERRAPYEISTDQPITVAIMGCAVNGPGEAREADIGIAGGVGEAVIFEHGEIVGKGSEEKIIDMLIERINEMNRPRQ